MTPKNSPTLPSKPIPQSLEQAKRYTELEAQRSKMFGNSVSPTPEQYAAADSALTRRPVTINYQPLGADPMRLQDRIHETGNFQADVASLAIIASLQGQIDSLSSQVSTLNTLVSGLSRRTVHICDSGTDKTMTIISTAPA